MSPVRPMSRKTTHMLCFITDVSLVGGHLKYTKGPGTAKSSTLFHARSDDVVPFAVKLFALDLQFSQFLLCTIPSTAQRTARPLVLGFELADCSLGPVVEGG